MACSQPHHRSAQPDAVCHAAGPHELDDLEVSKRLACTCYELYRRVPAGLAPEIAFFLPPRVPWPKAHPADIGGGDFVVKAQVPCNTLDCTRAPCEVFSGSKLTLQILAAAPLSRRVYGPASGGWSTGMGRAELKMSCLLHEGPCVTCP